MKDEPAWLVSVLALAYRWLHDPFLQPHFASSARPVAWKVSIVRGRGAASRVGQKNVPSVFASSLLSHIGHHTVLTQ